MTRLKPREERALRGLLSVSNTIDGVLGAIAKIFGWCFMVMVIIICFDVISRKFGFQLYFAGIDLGSTRLQELEWHFHSFLFLTWIGYCYVQNAHVRIDVFTTGLSARSQAKLELLGCVIFALPYVLVALPHSWDFFTRSWFQNEASSAPNGLPWRWIVKWFLFYGFFSILLSVISVGFRRIVFLFGSPDMAQEAMPDAAKATH
jgi:TRAP-type mannitol/chloroaromatic compound transport system permease small subunit